MKLLAQGTKSIIRIFIPFPQEEREQVFLPLLAL